VIQTNTTHKPGYKHTSLGWIPEEWEIKELNGIAEKIGDGLHGTPEYVKASEYFFVNGNNLVNGSIQINPDTKCVGIDEYKKHKKTLKERAILLSINGTIGNIALYKNEKIVLGKSAAYINCKFEDVGYLYHMLQSAMIISYFEGELTGSTIRNLSLKSIRETPIPFPLLSERHAIATLLSTWDKSIETTTRLIAQKELRKKWLMQQLLTGKKRLRGFSGEWKEVKLSQLGEIVTGNTPSMAKPEYYGGKYCWATAFDFNGVYIHTTKIKLTEEGKMVARIVPKGSVLITCIASIGKNGIANVEMAFNQQINAIVPNKSFNSAFIYYKIESSLHKLREVAGAGAVSIINKSNFENIKLTFPSIKEQTAIASVLQTADKEIQTLKSKLQKLKEQKKGLMQVLLTGKKRLNLDLSD
jgi:type I restriction enzyme S subunit